MTVKDLVESSMRLIGALASGETASASELSDAIIVLNDLLGSWSAQSLLIPQTTREVFTLTASQSSYTIGTGGDFVTTRPMNIINAAVEINGYESPLRVIDSSEWSDIPIKTLQSGFPTHIYTEGSSPLETIKLYPVPSSGLNIILYSQKAFTSFALGSDLINFPPGYSRALRYSLAMELAPEFGTEPSAIVIQTAMEAKGDIQRQNTEVERLISDAIGLTSVKRSFNIYTGE